MNNVTQVGVYIRQIQVGTESTVNRAIAKLIEIATWADETAAKFETGEIVEAIDIDDMLHDDPRYVNREIVETTIDAGTVEMYGEHYVKVMDLYELYPPKKG